MSYFAFSPFYRAIEAWCVIYTYGTSPAQSQVSNSHMWLLATTRDSTGTEAHAVTLHSLIRRESPFPRPPRSVSPNTSIGDHGQGLLGWSRCVLWCWSVQMALVADQGGSQLAVAGGHCRQGEGEGSLQKRVPKCP